jgi:hypothetical protein
MKNHTGKSIDGERQSDDKPSFNLSPFYLLADDIVNWLKLWQPDVLIRKLIPVHQQLSAFDMQIMRIPDRMGLAKTTRQSGNI